MPDSIMEQFLQSSHFNGGNAGYVEELYEQYIHDPNGVSDEWRAFFDSLPRVDGAGPDVSHANHSAALRVAGSPQGADGTCSWFRWCEY